MKTIATLADRMTEIRKALKSLVLIIYEYMVGIRRKADSIPIISPKAFNIDLNCIDVY